MMFLKNGSYLAGLTQRLWLHGLCSGELEESRKEKLGPRLSFPLSSREGPRPNTCPVPSSLQWVVDQPLLLCARDPDPGGSQGAGKTHRHTVKMPC